MVEEYKNSFLNTNNFKDIICNNVIFDSLSSEYICLDEKYRGVVLEKEIYYGPPRKNENSWRDLYIQNLEKKNINNPSVKRVKTIEKRIKYYDKLYKKAMKYIESKEWLDIDFNRLIERKKMIYTLISRASREAESNIKKDKNIEKYVILGENIIKECAPKGIVYLHRSIRGKKALCYTLAYYFKEKRFPEKEKVIPIFNISSATFRRIKKDIFNIEKFIKRECLEKLLERNL